MLVYEKKKRMIRSSCVYSIYLNHLSLFAHESIHSHPKTGSSGLQFGSLHIATTQDPLLATQ